MQETDKSSKLKTQKQFLSNIRSLMSKPAWDNEGMKTLYEQTLKVIEDLEEECNRLDN